MTIRLHRVPLSGHAHRVELMLSLLGLPFEIVEVDLAGGAHKTPAFLAMNPFGQVPVIEDGEATLADSNAILVYLASRYDTSGRWLPRDPLGAAAVQRWLSVAAGQLANGPAPGAGRGAVQASARSAARIARRRGCSSVMEAHLAQQDFLAGDRADHRRHRALHLHRARARRRRVARALPDGAPWLARIEALPGFVGMRRSPDAPPLSA